MGCKSSKTAGMSKKAKGDGANCCNDIVGHNLGGPPNVTPILGDDSKMSYSMCKPTASLGVEASPASMNDILTNCSNSFISRSSEEVLPLAKSRKKKGRKKKKVQQSLTHKLSMTSADILDDVSAKSSLVSQLTYIEGLDNATGLGLGYRISKTYTETGSKSRKKTSNATIVI